MAGFFCQLQLVLFSAAFSSCFYSLLIPNMELRKVRFKNSSSTLFPLSLVLFEIPDLQIIICHLCLSKLAQRPHNERIFINQ